MEFKILDRWGRYPNGTKNQVFLTWDVEEQANFNSGYGPNSWKVVLYRDLAADDWFCNGGFKNITG